MLLLPLLAGLRAACAKAQAEDPAPVSMPAVGTYVFGAGAAAWATYSAGGMQYYAGIAPGYNTGGGHGSGTITVAAYTASSITGTFDFTAIDPAPGSPRWWPTASFTCRYSAG